MLDQHLVTNLVSSLRVMLNERTTKLAERFAMLNLKLELLKTVVETKNESDNEGDDEWETYLNKVGNSANSIVRFSESRDFKDLMSRINI